MRQLKTDQQIISPSVFLLVRLHQRLTQLRDSSLVALGDDQLIRIRAAVRMHGHRLAAPDQFRAALAKTLPTPQHRLGDAASRGPIPTFHRMNRPAIANAAAIEWN